MSSDDDFQWKDVFHFPYGEEGGLLDFLPDGKTAYLTSSLGRETTALLKVDVTTGETLEELYSNDKCNVGGVTLDKETKEIRALTYNYARTVWYIMMCALSKKSSSLPSSHTLFARFTFPSRDLPNRRNAYSSTRNSNETMPSSKRLPPNPIVK